MLFTGILIVFLGVVSAVPEFHRLRVHHKGMHADEDVLIDTDEGYAVTTVSNINGTGTPSINLHDTTTGFTAIKDVVHGKCYLQQTNHTMQDFKDAVNRAMQDHTSELAEYEWTCQRQPIPSGMLKPVFGEKIAQFCMEYESFFVNRKLIPHQKRAASERQSFWCFICIFALC